MSSRRATLPGATGLPSGHTFVPHTAVRPAPVVYYDTADCKYKFKDATGVVREYEMPEQKRRLNPDDSGNRGSIGLADVLTELELAEKEYPRPFVNAHEGYAVILEELDELKAEVWKSPGSRNNAKMRNEAIQVAAMALRFLKDCCPKNQP